MSRAAEWIADSEKRAIEARDKIILEIAMDLYDANKKIRVLREALTDSREYVQSWGEIVPKACEPLAQKEVRKIDVALAKTF